MTKKVEFDVVPKVSKGAVANIKKTIGDTLSTGFGASSAIRGTAFSSDIGGAVSKASNALGKVFKQITDFTGGLAAMSAVDNLEHALSPLISAVSKVNPALAEQASEAFEDIRAVIAESLQPVLQAFLPVIRQFGDFIANIVPSQGAVNGLMQAFQPILDSLKETMETITPITRFMTSTFTIMGTVIGAAAKAVQFFVHILNEFIGFCIRQGDKLAGIAGNLAGGGGGSLLAGGLYSKVFSGLLDPATKTSRGAAIHAASYHGIESLGHDLAQAAFSQGGRKTPEEETAKNTEDTRTIAQRILDVISTETSTALTGNVG
jgi:hypothetical protein